MNIYDDIPTIQPVGEWRTSLRQPYRLDWRLARDSHWCRCARVIQGHLYLPRLAPGPKYRYCLS